VVALAEVALAAHEPGAGDADLTQAIRVLRKRGELDNAQRAELLRARHALAVGEVDRAERLLRALDLTRGAPALRASFALTEAELALRHTLPVHARRALAKAERAAQEAMIPALQAEVAQALQDLERPVASLLKASPTSSTLPCPSLLSLDQVATLTQGPGLIVDARRRHLHVPARSVDLATRPVLFELALQLALAAPREVTREDLIRLGFGIKRPSDSLRARLRVAMARLRKLLRGLAEVEATANGFALLARTPSLYVLSPASDDEASRLLALLADGEGWSTSALALALGESQRSVQRALKALESLGKVRSFGRGRNRRWLVPPLTPFATHLLLPVSSRLH
jgi:hypothetical protein